MQSETGLDVKAGRGRSFAIFAAMVFLLGSAGLYLFARDAYSEHQIRHLIDAAYNFQRPGGGRLSNAEYSPSISQFDAKADLGKAQLLLLQLPDSDTKQRLQSLIYLAS